MKGDLPFLQKKMKRIEEAKKERIRKRIKNNLHSPEARAQRRLTKALDREFRVRELTDKQKFAIHLMVDFVHKWPVSYIASQVGVSTQTIANWKNDPFFLKELDKEITRRKTVVRLSAFRNLFKLVEQGHFKALNMYFKMTGDLQEVLDTKDTGAAVPEDRLDIEIQRLQDELGIEVVRDLGRPTVETRKALRAINGQEKS